MKSFSSKIWTRVAVSISYDDKHYTTGTSTTINMMIGVCNENIICKLFSIYIWPVN